MTEPDPNADLHLSPACHATVDRLQLVLDGELHAAALDSDAHAGECAACRGRIAAVRLVQSALAAPAERSVPAGLTDGILSAVREERYARIRQRSYLIATGLGVALAASLLLVGWLNQTPKPDVVPLGPLHVPDMAHVAPEPRPVRLGDEFSKVGQAILGSSKPITEPVGSAPQMLSQLTNTLTRPAAPAGEFDQARKSLADLPNAARAGLEPVTGTAQKAFTRLMRDFGAVQVTKPKS